MLDLAPATIRTWETRYGHVVPQRSDGGQRIYSRDQVDQLRFVRDEIVAGRRPAEAHRLLAERLASGESVAGVRMRVLLAETRVGAAEMLRQLLGAEGFDVLLATDPDSATRWMNELAPTFAVIDTDDAAFAELARELQRRGGRVVSARRMLRQIAQLGA
jgi:DNA-binding transcriptional MerR regulator